MIQTDIYSLLSSSEPLTALVNTGIYPVFIPAGSSLPCVTYSVTSNVTNGGYSLDMTWSNRARVTVDVFSAEYLNACTISAAIHSVLDGYTGGEIQLITPENEQDFCLSDSMTYRQSMDFYVYY
jgi:Protein of unknown function (DUF3168)